MKEYDMILDFYQDKVAKRSQVPLMNHIDEGIIILDYIGASIEAKKAFCLHPLTQSNNELLLNHKQLCTDINPMVLIYVMEYRNIANAYLNKVDSHITFDNMQLSPLDEVNRMLVADKVQNHRDFQKYHKQHERYNSYCIYFSNWLNKLALRFPEHANYILQDLN